MQNTNITNSILITTIQNPFDPYGSRIVKIVEYTGKTAQNYALEFFPEILEEFDIVGSINGEIVEDLTITIPQKNSNLVLCLVPQGGGSNSIVRSVAMIAVVVMSMYCPLLLGVVGMYNTALLTASVMMAGTMLVNALLPPPGINSDNGSASPAYGWTVQNQTSEGFAWPVIYGTVKTLPYVIGVHTRNISVEGYATPDKQRLNILYAVADHGLDSIENVKINGNDYDGYEDISITTRLGNFIKTIEWIFRDSLQDFETVVDCELTAQEDSMLVAATDADPYFFSPDDLTIDGSQDYIIHMKIKRISGEGWDGRVFYKTSGHTFTSSYYKDIAEPDFEEDTWYFIEWDMSDLTVGDDDWITSTITQLRFDLGMGVDDDFEIGWIHVGYGGYDQAVIENFRDTHTQSSVQRKINDSDWQEINVPGSDITGIGIGVSYPNGLGRWGSKLHSRRVNIEVQYSKQSPESWIPWINQTTEGKESCAINWHQENSDLSPDSYKIRARSITPWTPNPTVHMDQYISYVEGIVKDDFRYPGASLLSVNAMATDQLSGGMPATSCIANRSTVNVYETGVGWTTKPANNPAWIAYDMHVNDEYGAGVAYTRMIYADFEEWATFCTTNNYVCNIVFDTNEPFPKQLAKVCLVGRGNVVQKGTKFGVVIDQESSPVQLFGIGNIRQGTFKQTFLTKTDRINAIEFTFWNKDDDYKKQTYEVRSSTYDTATTDVNKLSLTFYGITSKVQAIKQAKFMMNCNEYLQRVVEFEVDIDALASHTGNVIYVSHDLPQWGYSGRVVSATSTTVEIDREVTMSPGTTYHIMVRHYDDDDLEEVAIASVAEETTTDELTLNTSWDQTPQKDDIYTFGEINHLAREFRITKISRAQKMGRKVTALEYLSEVYSDDATIPDYEDDSDLDPTVSNLMAVEVIRSEGGQMISFVSLTWNGWGIHYVYMKEESAAQWSLMATLSGENYCEIKSCEHGKTYWFAVSTTANPLDGETSSLTFKGYTSSGDIWPVAGLEICGQGHSTVWQGKDLKLCWHLTTSTGDEAAGEEANGAGTYPSLTEFGGYILQIYNSDGTSRRESQVVNDGFIYTYEMNVEDGNGTPEAVLIVQVYALDLYGRRSKIPATITVTNPAPGAVSSLTAEPWSSGVNFIWSESTETDFHYYLFRDQVEDDGWSEWKQTTAATAFRGLTSTEIADHGRSATIYIEVKVVDTFGNMSDAQSAQGDCEGLNIDPTDIEDFAITASKIFTKIPILEADSWTDNSPSAGYVAWNSHKLYFNGVEYSIANSNTDKKYIYWDGVSDAYTASDTNPILTDDQFIIAVNINGSHDLAWHAIANQVIGSAYIEDLAVVTAKINDLAVTTAKIDDLAVSSAKIKSATITDAQIGSLNADKITAGTLDAERIGAGSITVGKLDEDATDRMFESDERDFEDIGGVTKPDDNATKNEIFKQNAPYLSFVEQTGKFLPGQILYGASSGAYATISTSLGDKVYLYNVNGTFEDEEILYVLEYEGELITASQDRNFSEDLGNWALSDNVDEATLTWDGTNPDGEKVAKLTCTDNTYYVGDGPYMRGYLLSDYFETLNENEYYILSSNIYADDNNPGITEVAVQIGGFGGTSRKTYMMTLGDWETCNVIFQHDTGIGASIAIMVSDLTPITVVYYDDVSLKRIRNAAKADGILQNSEPTATLDDLWYETISGLVLRHDGSDWHTITDVTPSLPSDDNLKGYWSFDDGSGLIAIDNSGNNNNGTLENDPTWTVGKSGLCLLFNETDNTYVDCGNDNSLEIFDYITYSAWVYLTIDKEYVYIISRSYRYPFTLFMYNGSLRIGITFSDDSLDYRNIGTMPLNQWVHVAATYNSNTGEFAGYINGIQELSYTYPALLLKDYENAYNLQIGKGVIDGGYFEGYIDEVRIYNQVLTPDEIQALYFFPSGNESAVKSWETIYGDYKPEDNADVTKNHQFIRTLGWTFENTVDGFGAEIHCTLTAQDNSMLVTSTDSDPYFSCPASQIINGSRDFCIRMRIKRTGGTGWEGRVYYSTDGGHGYSGSYHKDITEPAFESDTWYVLEWDMSDLTAGDDDWVTSTITRFRFDLGSGSGDNFEIDWICLGHIGMADKVAGPISGVAAPAGAGLYLGSDYMGYFDASVWKTFMDSDGNFYLGGTAGPLQWDADGNQLCITGSVVVTGGDYHSSYNHIKNGDFEKDTDGEESPTDWTIETTGTPVKKEVFQTTATYWPPWKPEGNVFYGSCDDAAEYVRLTTSDYINIDITKHYCLSAYVRGISGTRKVYLGINCYDSDHVIIGGTRYTTMGAYSPDTSWEQKTGIMYPYTETGETNYWPSNCAYAKIKGYAQYQAVGANLISRIQFVEGQVPSQWPVVDGGSIQPGTVFAEHLSISNLADIANLEIGSTGFIRSEGKESFDDDTAGIWIGYEDSKHKLNIGDGTYKLTWDGSQFSYSGFLAGVTAAGTTHEIIRSATEVTVPVGFEWEIVKEIFISRSGTYKVKFDAKLHNDDYSGTAVCIYKNGVSHGTIRYPVTEWYVTFSENLVFEANDLCQIYAYTMTVGTGVYVENFLLEVDYPINCIVTQDEL